MSRLGSPAISLPAASRGTTDGGIDASSGGPDRDTGACDIKPGRGRRSLRAGSALEDGEGAMTAVGAQQATIKQLFDIQASSEEGDVTLSYAVVGKVLEFLGKGENGCSWMNILPLS